jgi:hypothetical protein
MAYWLGRQPELPPSEEMRRQGRWALHHDEGAPRAAPSITVLMGTKCHSRNQTLNAAKGRYPVYVQQISCGNPEEPVRITDEDAMEGFLPGEGWWSRQSHATVLPVRPVIAPLRYEAPPIRQVPQYFDQW